ncbi:hypothetical protein K445DRAFT_25994 [Daldinia sp. EC12]|nr:hypothetical protein K445DRAFT_25994 [Daldinia sp. EC12]
MKDFKLIATVDRAITTGLDSIRDVGWYDASFLVAMCANWLLVGKTYILSSKKYAILIYLVFEVSSLVIRIGTWSSMFAVASIAGPVVGGAVTQARRLRPGVFISTSVLALSTYIFSLGVGYSEVHGLRYV